jgi:hypothetical protein
MSNLFDDHDENLVFFRTRFGRRVHVRTSMETMTGGPGGDSFAAGLWSLFNSSMVAACGARLHASDKYRERGGGRIGSFSDDDLCISCMRSLSEDDRVRVFDQRVQDEADDR